VQPNYDGAARAHVFDEFWEKVFIGRGCGALIGDYYGGRSGV